MCFSVLIFSLIFLPSSCSALSFPLNYEHRSSRETQRHSHSLLPRRPPTWGVRAPSFALLLLLLLALLALVLGQLQQVLGNLVVGFAALERWVGRWRRRRHGKRIEALPFVLGPLGLQLRLGGRWQRGGGEFKRLQLQRARAACKLELVRCRGRSSLQWGDKETFMGVYADRVQFSVNILYISTKQWNCKCFSQ